ncbi:MAG: xylose isomerase [Planctomycetes bacterium]|nr:xylose isomerase [Planctomycetota bacterium]
MDRRTFITTAAVAPVAFAASGSMSITPRRHAFDISLAQWSLHRALNAGKIDHLDFAKIAKKDLGIDAIEYVNTFFKKKAKDEKYLGEMKKRADDLGVKSLLIMVDREGALGDANEKRRGKAVDNHVRWLDAAKFLGCHSIRVNAKSSGTWEEQRDRAADGLRRLSKLGDERGLNVIVENHGGLSSNGKWLAEVMKKVDHKRCGTLPDFGNFRIAGNKWYDRYRGVEELMPWAKAVSAKSHDFDDKGNETNTDYAKMLGIVLKAGYSGYIGIEYEGGKLDEMAGIKMTRDLMLRLRKQLHAK